ncbi:hypothetical protein HOD08_00635 [bacterium]|nr:hypothetical protein [bacterium]
MKKILTSIFVAAALATPQCFCMPQEQPAYMEKVEEARNAIEETRAKSDLEKTMVEGLDLHEAQINRLQLLVVESSK